MGSVFSNYVLVGGEDTYRNPLNQSPLAFRRLENLIPSVTGELEQKGPSFSISVGATVQTAVSYGRVNADGTTTRMLLLGTADGRVLRLLENGTTPAELFPAGQFAPLTRAPAFVQGNSNLVYFTDGERFFVTNGELVKQAGLDHPLDPPTLSVETSPPGVLNVPTNRYYWVVWADMDAEFGHIGSSSPRSEGTGPVTNGKVFVTRPNYFPPRATHWLLFASEVDGDSVFGAWLGTIPVSISTFEDQSPFLGEEGTAMVPVRRPIRNQVPVPGAWAKLHKGRIFVGGFNRLPVVIRNPGFNGAGGWALDGAATVAAEAAFDGPNGLRIYADTNDGVVVAAQPLGTALQTGKRYVLEVAVRRTGTVGGGRRLQVGVTGAVPNPVNISTPADPADVWKRSASYSFVPQDPTQFYEVIIEFSGLPGGGSWPDSGTGTHNVLYFRVDAADTPGDRQVFHVDFLRLWEIVPPTNIAYSALEEVESLQHGRGEECFPGCTAPPKVEDASDLVNLLTFPEEARELVGAESFVGSLFVWSDTAGAAVLGDSFDDFGFYATELMPQGLAGPLAVAKARAGMFFLSSDLKLYRVMGESGLEELSLPVRRDLARISLAGPRSLAVYDFGERAWAVLVAEEDGARRVRLFDLDLRQWFRFTEWTSPTLAIVYEPVLGKKVLLVADGTSLRVAADPLGAYPAGSGQAPAARFRQVLLDLSSPTEFKTWGDVTVHTTGTPSLQYWIDPVDPDNPGSGTVAQFKALDQLPSLYRVFLRQQPAGAYGKRLLVEVTLPAATVPAKVFGIEVEAEASTRYAR